MAVGKWTLTNAGLAKMLTGIFDLDTDSYKVALLTSTSNIGAASTTHAAVTGEHANANGYTTGGIAVVLVVTGTTTVMVDFQTDPTWTATTGPITARWAELYEVGGDVMGYCLLNTTPADETATAGNTFKVEADPTGIFQFVTQP